ncbi:MAG: arginase family protein [Acidobacteriota bacterium]
MKIAVIGVPSAWGTAEIGVSETPNRLRRAGLLEWLAAAGLEVEDAGDVEVPRGRDQHPLEPGSPAGSDEPLPHLSQVCTVCGAVRTAVEEALAAPSLPFLVGGECGLAAGVVPALAGEISPTTVVWLDAHGDLNTPETSPSGLITGMPLAILMGKGHPKLLTAGAGSPRPRPENIWLIGGRDMDAGELATVAALPMHHVDIQQVRRQGAEALATRILQLPADSILPPEARTSIQQPPPEHPDGAETRRRRCQIEPPPGRPAGHLYLHIDVDAIDPGEAPGVNYRVAGGLGTDEVADLAGYLCASGQVAALTVASANLTRDQGGKTIAALRTLVTSLADALGTER